MNLAASIAAFVSDEVVLSLTGRPSTRNDEKRQLHSSSGDMSVIAMSPLVSVPAQNMVFDNSINDGDVLFSVALLPHSDKQNRHDEILNHSFVLISCFDSLQFPNCEGVAMRTTWEHLSSLPEELLLTAFRNIQTRSVGVASGFHLYLLLISLRTL